MGAFTLIVLLVVAVTVFKLVKLVLRWRKQPKQRRLF